MLILSIEAFNVSRSSAMSCRSEERKAFRESVSGLPEDGFEQIDGKVCAREMIVKVRLERFIHQNLHLRDNGFSVWLEDPAEHMILLAKGSLIASAVSRARSFVRDTS
jgi:hypothetical protein